MQFTEINCLEDLLNLILYTTATERGLPKETVDAMKATRCIRKSIKGWLLNWGLQKFDVNKLKESESSTFKDDVKKYVEVAEGLATYEDWNKATVNENFCVNASLIEFLKVKTEDYDKVTLKDLVPVLQFIVASEFMRSMGQAEQMITSHLEPTKPEVEEVEEDKEEEDKSHNSTCKCT